MDRDAAGILRQAIVSVEAARLDAMIAADLPVLGGLLDDSLSYVHSTGRSDNKETLLAFISGGTVRYLDIEHELNEVREAVSGLAVATGTMRIRLVGGGVEKFISTRTTNVWMSGGATWSLLAFQATTLSGS